MRLITVNFLLMAFFACSSILPGGNYLFHYLKDHRTAELME